MKHAKGISVGVLLAAMAVFGAYPVIAQDKGKDTKAAPAAKAEKGTVTVKTVFENDKVRAQEVTYKPGDENRSVARNNYGRVIRALTSGTLQRTYPDGKTESNDWKAGDVRYIEPTSGAALQYTTKNVGKSDVVLFVVQLKETSKAAPAKK